TEITKSFKLGEENYTTSKADIDWKKDKSLVIAGDENEDDGESIMQPGFFTWLASDEDPLNLGAQIANDIFPDAVSLFNSATSDDLNEEDISDLDEEDIEETDDDEEDAPASKKQKK
ncbi:hypothetical protein SYNPS1DRAFT_29889, partial [Syncephalis pseudoplumigaleata]